MDAKVHAYFDHVVLKYNCGDIQALLEAQLEQAGPLLACTVNGIDTAGGMMLGFSQGSKNRSVAFMSNDMSLTSEESEWMYSAVRCGLAHEGVPNQPLRFFVHYERCDRGTFLYSGFGDRSLWLNVTELAYCYVDAIHRIASNVHEHMNHVPSPRPQDVKPFQQAHASVKANITEFWSKRGSTKPGPRSSLTPFFADALRHFSVNPPNGQPH
jgi:hypothetical protein